MIRVVGRYGCGLGYFTFIVFGLFYGEGYSAALSRSHNLIEIAGCASARRADVSNLKIGIAFVLNLERVGERRAGFDLAERMLKRCDGEFWFRRIRSGF